LPRGRRTVLGAIYLVSIGIASVGVVACGDGNTPSSPVTGTQAVLDSGQAVFNRYCAVCHPGGNRGSGPALRPLVPNRTDAQLRDVIRTGKAQMPGYKSGQISDEQMDHLIAYMRSLK